jgi:hypothetical protein
MTDRSASSQRSTLLNSAVPETPSLNEKQFLHQLKPVLLPPSKNGAKQPIGSRKPRLLSPELPAGSKEEGCRSPSRKHQFHFWLAGPGTGGGRICSPHHPKIGPGIQDQC